MPTYNTPSTPPALPRTLNPQTLIGSSNEVYILTSNGWRSLQGSTGATGDPGPQGPPGLSGADGSALTMKGYVATSADLPSGVPGGGVIPNPVAIGNGNTTASSTSVAATTSVAVEIGETILVAAIFKQTGGRALTSVTDSAGNVYTIDNTRSHASNGANVGLARSVATAALPVSGTVTANFSGAAATGARIIAVAKTTKSLSFEASDGGSASGTSAAYTSTGVNVTGDNRMLWGVAQAIGGTSSTSTNSIQELQDIAANATTIVTGYRMLPSGSGTYVFSGNWNTSQGWEVATAVYYAAGGGGQLNNKGDTYIVQADDSIWIWDGTQWVSGGSIQGPKGDPGATGPAGSAGHGLTMKGYVATSSDLPGASGVTVPPPTVIGQNTSTSGTSVVITTTDAVAIGETILIGASHASFSRTLSSVTDSAGNVYVVDGAVGASTTAMAGAAHSVATVALPAGGTITCNFTGTGSSSAHAAVAAKISLSLVFMSTTNTTGTTAAFNAPAITTSSDNRFLWGVAHGAPNATSWVAGGSNVELTEYAPQTSAVLATGYQVVGAKGTYTFSGTWANAATWACVVSEFRSTATITTNVQGDAYIVQADDSLWVWDGTQWVSGGSIQGPPGATGPAGATGPQGATGAVGPVGPGIRFKGNVATVGDLPAGAAGAISPPTFLGAASASAFGTDVTFALTTSVNVDETILIAAGTRNSGTARIQSASDSKGNAYTVDVFKTHSSGTQPTAAGIARAVVTSALASGDTITATFPSAAVPRMIVVAKTTSKLTAVDKTATTDGTSVTAYATGTMDTTVANELLFGMACAAGAQTSTPGTGIVEVTPDYANTAGGGSASLSVGYQVLSATGSYTYNGTFSAAAIFTVAAATYSASGSGANTPGDAYIVQADDSFWVWDGTHWVNGGSIQGPPGAGGVTSSKQPCRVASTGNLAIPGPTTSYSIDGVAIGNNDRVLVKNQTSSPQNGIYVFQTGVGLSRASDLDSVPEFPGAYVWVNEGTVNADTGWVCTNDDSMVLDTTGVVWVRFGVSSLAGHIIQDESVALTQRSKLNFVGPTVQAVDDAPNDTTTVNIGVVDAASYRAGGNGPVLSIGTTWTALDPRVAGVLIDPAGSFTENTDFSVSVRDAGWYTISATVATSAVFDNGIHVGIGTTAGVANDLAMSGGRGSAGTGAQATATTTVKLTAGQKVFVTGYAAAVTNMYIRSFSIARVGGPQGASGQALDMSATYHRQSTPVATTVAQSTWTMVVLSTALAITNASGSADFTRNADGSLTANQAGTYDLTAVVESISAMPDATNVNVNLCRKNGSTPSFTDSIASLNVTMGGTNNNFPSVPVTLAAPLAAGDRIAVWLWTNGTTNLTWKVSSFSCVRTGAGPAGPKGDPGLSVACMSGGGASTPIPANAASFAILPTANFSQSTDASAGGYFVLNADGTITAKVAGWYTVACSTSGPAMASETGMQHRLCYGASDATPTTGNTLAMADGSSPVPSASVTWIGQIAANTRLGLLVANRDTTIRNMSMVAFGIAKI